MSRLTSSHFCFLRVRFDVSLGVLGVYCCLYEASCLSSCCTDCIETIFDLDADGNAELLPSLVAHESFVRYLSDPAFRDKFGFTIMSQKIERHHHLSFMYLVVCFLVYVFFEVLG